MPLASPALPALRKESNFQKAPRPAGATGAFMRLRLPQILSLLRQPLSFSAKGQMNGSESVSRERTPSLPEEEKTDSSRKALRGRREQHGSNDRAAKHAFFLLCPLTHGEAIGLSKKLLVVPGGVYGGHRTIESGENPIFQGKNRFHAVFAPENLKDFSKNCKGQQRRSHVICCYGLARPLRFREKPKG